MSAQIKSGEEIAIMRKSGQILANVLSELAAMAKPGITTKELDEQAEKMIRASGAVPAFKGYKNYPATICTNINEEVVHTFPSNRKLRDGDILTIDCGVNLKGLNTDSAITIAVGKVPAGTHLFIETVKQTLYGAINLVKPGRKIGEISNFIQTNINRAGYYIIRELVGHGIGRSLHEDPQIPNFGKKSKGLTLKSGMTICIEPIVGYSTRLIDTAQDGWCIKTRDGSLSCQQEHTVLVTATGFDILTKRKEEMINHI